MKKKLNAIVTVEEECLFAIMNFWMSFGFKVMIKQKVLIIAGLSQAMCKAISDSIILRADFSGQLDIRCQQIVFKILYIAWIVAINNINIITTKFLASETWSCFSRRLLINEKEIERHSYSGRGMLIRYHEFLNVVWL